MDRGDVIHLRLKQQPLSFHHLVKNSNCPLARTTLSSSQGNSATPTSPSFTARGCGGLRLTHTKTLELQEFWGSYVPRYAILSHAWEEEEVTIRQVTQLPKEELAKRKGFAKIKETCNLARGSGIQWAWIDTCCIDKSRSAELTEAINSMFKWYENSYVCYAHLSDLKDE